MATTAMATCSFSFGLRICNERPEVRYTTVQCTPFTKKRTSISKLSSSHSISGLHPLVSNHVSASFCRNSQSMAVVCAKGYKMKTHKPNTAKRFRVSGSGKIMRRRAGKQHLLAKKNNKRKLRLSKMVQVNRSDYNNVIGALPYLKVNRSN